MLEFSSVLMRGEVEGEDLELVGDILGKMLWPGENKEEPWSLSDLPEGGWKAEGKDLMMLVESPGPGMENRGLKGAEVRPGSRDSRAGWRNGETADWRGKLGRPSGRMRPRLGRNGEGEISFRSAAWKYLRFGLDRDSSNADQLTVNPNGLILEMRASCRGVTERPLSPEGGT